MQGLVLGLYYDFSCMAGQCPSTCCAGWRIVVDRQDVERFRTLENRQLRENILSNIEERDGQYSFRNGRDGRCAMLDADGLCRIQRKLSEEALCNTCRKFPRLTAQTEEGLWISMAASCPVVAAYLYRQPVQWYSLGQPQQPVALSSISVWQESRQYIHRNYGAHAMAEPLFETFLDVAMDCLDMVLQFPECSYLADSFDFYQEEGSQKEAMEAFLQNTKGTWQRFFENYLSYRIPSRYLEFPAETGEERVLHIFGELLLLRIILCSRFQCRNGLQEADWLESIAWLYRFCAHGKSRERRIHELFIHKHKAALPQAFPFPKS